MEINRRHLWKSNYDNLLRLARALGINGVFCNCTACKEKIIEKVIRLL